jgi:glutamate carboxypeptidase
LGGVTALHLIFHPEESPTMLTTFSHRFAAPFLLAAACVLSCLPASAQAQLDGQVQQMAASEQPKLLETLKTVVEMESGSTNRAGLDVLSSYIADRLKALGGTVEFIEPNAADLYRMEDTPEKPEGIGRAVKAVFKGGGTAKILLIAHMDTVYPAGWLSRQPWRIDGNRAFGLGIADDKQGVAMILHTVGMLQALGVRNYGQLTVLINGDEEISSPASRNWLAREGAAHDAVMSFEGSRHDSDKLALATSGIALATLTVKGRASHAGGAPERGVNALYELSHQLLQMRDLSIPATGLKMNWTVSRAGVVRNMIPPGAQAWADIRMLKVADLPGLEARVQERIKNKLLAESEVAVTFENRRPPLEATQASRNLGAHAQRIYQEIGKELVVDPVAEGGGTDAAFAALNTKAPVVERFGLRGFGAHSSDAEYVLIDSIQPRLYLATRLIMDLAAGKVR